MCTTTTAAAASGDNNSCKNLPSTLTGAPISKLVDPGQCQFGSTSVPCKLIERWPVSSTSAVLRFELPDPSQPLQLSTCACILARAKVGDASEEVTRPYTPISTNANVGYMDLLVKKYDGGKMSTHLHTMKVGDDSVNFFHIDKNVKIQGSTLCTKYDTIVMLVGGTGITPMIQALHAILGKNVEGEGHVDKKAHVENKPKVVMLYGSKTSDDILGQELLHAWAKDHSEQFTCVDILSDEPEDSQWDGARGYINEAYLQKYAPTPSSSDPFLILVCGPPPMYDALCGPRDEADKVSGLLGKMGYKPEQVYKF